jgi:oligoendopeptidase F
MQLDEDTRIGEHQALVSRMESLSVAAQEAGAFLVPEIMAIDKAIMNLYMGAGPLAEYKQYLDNILRFKAHTLSEKEEALLAMAGDLASAPSTVFEMLNAADMKFPVVEDAEGNKISSPTAISFRLWRVRTAPFVKIPSRPTTSAIRITFSPWRA